MTHRFKVRGQLPAPGQPDIDFTEPCLEMGTKFQLRGAMTTDRSIPVERAWIEDEVLYVEGTVVLEDDDVFDLEGFIPPIADG